MKNSEKGKFEDAWHKAFDSAEQAPSEGVWTGIEQELGKAETVVMKRKVIFYQRLAAASILFALLLGSLSTYYITELTGQLQITEDTEILPNTSVTDETRTIPSGIHQEATSDKVNTNDNSEVDIRKLKPNKNTARLITDMSGLNKNKELSGINGNQLNEYKIINDHNHLSLVEVIPEPSIALNGKLSEVIIIRKLPAMPAAFMDSKKDKHVAESLWAALGASTGNYSPSANFNSGTSSRALYQSTGGLNNTQGAYSTTAPKGSAFSVGMNLGKRLSKHWLLQGGVSYLNQTIGYTSNYAVVDVNNNAQVSVADYSNLKSSSIVVALSTPYEINSVNEYISIPVQAGYLLVDRKMGLQLNSGLSTDLFIKNMLTDKTGQMASYSSKSGGESPYRAVSWAGLLGTELSYKIAPQYRVSIAPGLRYSLNSVLKSNAVSSNPLVWDVGFRFRYIFK